MYDIPVVYLVAFGLSVFYSVVLNVVFGHGSFWRRYDIFHGKSHNYNNLRLLSRSHDTELVRNNSNKIRNIAAQIKNSIHTYILKCACWNISYCTMDKCNHLLLESSSNDIILHICSYLYCNELLELSKTSKRYHQLISNCDPLWKDLLYTTIQYMDKGVLSVMKTTHLYYQFLIDYKYFHQVVDDLITSDIEKYSISELTLDMKSKYHIIMNVIPKYIIKYLIKYQRSIVTIHDKIYDLTNFKQQHPGGSDVICEYNGLDATSIFDGATHSTIAIEYSRNFLLFSNQHYFYQSYLSLIHI